MPPTRARPSIAPANSSAPSEDFAPPPRLMKFRQLAIPRADDLLFGTAPKPLVTRHGLRIGGGLVYPELNFTLPPMEVTAATMPAVARHYRDISTGALCRAAELEAPGVVIEFETLPPMTSTPAFGLEIVQILLAGMDEAHRANGLRAVLRTISRQIDGRFWMDDGDGFHEGGRWRVVFLSVVVL
ncbi:MAG: hypothetical protein EXS32_15840, partial [Opitutus sp.]|nr:hypothetical protein [Opitutus sp.]